MTILEYTFDKLFQNINFSAFGADDSYGTLFLSRLILHTNQFHTSLNFILNVSLHNGLLMFPPNFSYNCEGHTRN